MRISLSNRAIGNNRRVAQIEQRVFQLQLHLQIHNKDLQEMATQEQSFDDLFNGSTDNVKDIWNSDSDKEDDAGLFQTSIYPSQGNPLDTLTQSQTQSQSLLTEQPVKKLKKVQREDTADDSNGSDDENMLFDEEIVNEDEGEKARGNEGAVGRVKRSVVIDSDEED